MDDHLDFNNDLTHRLISKSNEIKQNTVQVHESIDNVTNSLENINEIKQVETQSCNII